MKDKGKQTISNQEKLKRLKIRKILFYAIIVFGILTVVLSLFSLFNGINPIWAIICFCLEAFFSKWRTSIDPEIGKRIENPSIKKK